MTSIRVKYRSSMRVGKEGRIFYQIIHSRVSRQISTAYRVFEDEWDKELSSVIAKGIDNERDAYLSEVRDGIRCDMGKLRRIVEMLEASGEVYHSDEVVAAFLSEGSKCNLFEFMEDVIASLRKLGKVRTAEAYMTTLSSFRRFREDVDVPLDKVDSDVMLAYEAYLKSMGISPNASSFYMRNLRAVYNRAVEKGITVQRYPFRQVYTGVDKTVKRAVSAEVIKHLKEMDFGGNKRLDFARDMFMFSFYTRGMSFVDMAYLKKRDLANGILSYRRRKTGQQLLIRWEKPMQEIVEKYDTSGSEYLLPIVKHSQVPERTQYIYAGHRINRYLKIIGERLGIHIPLTMYVARHSWASIAKSKHIPMSVISEGMGHDSEATTRIYLASLDNNEIDKANYLIIKSI